MKQVDIYIRESGGGREIRIPWLPDEIEFKTNGALRAQYKILNSGETEVPAGRNLKSCTWNSRFPGEANKQQSFLRGTWKSPDSYHKTISEWKDQQTELTLIITGTPVNIDVYIDEYSAKFAGGSGDIFYDIELKQRRTIKITSKANTTTKTTTGSSSTNKTYTIKKGDTLWAIARKYLGAGSKYTTLYSLNKDIIEQTAKKHKKKSSNGGHWIYPGTVIKLP